jgi:three-Cys-motif partner protein
VTSAPRTTLWPLDPHTRAKHEILRHYLDAWIPILSLGKFPKLVYIDGFAGPGRYSKGEDGSPILAVRAVLAQKVAITANLEFYFVEKEADRSLVLESLIREIPLPRNLACSVLTALFEEAYASTIKPQLERIPRAPVFAFLDPFGYTGIALSIIREILQRPSAEVLVTFMYEEINRFALVEGQASHMDQLFGTNEWRGIAALQDVAERRAFFEGLYARQLRGCTKFVRSFEMRNKKDATDYFLFYATSHPLGLAKMKEAMWRVDPGGEFTFSDASDPNQAVLFSGEPDHEALGNMIHAAFRGQIATVRDVESFVVEQTAFTASHHKKALKALEFSEPPKVQPMDATATRRRGTYPDENMRLRFV